MKTKTFYSVLFFISLTICFAQEEEDEFSSIFNGKQNSLSTLSSFSNNQNMSLGVVNNIIFIQQVGNNNQVDSSITSNVSNVTLTQDGRDNYIFIDKTASEINQFVSQQGNNNEVYDFNFSSENPLNNNFSQSGNNLNLINIGANSISKEITVKQSGNSGTVIILNK